MRPLIKWPGGKSGELKKIKDLIPQYQRYIEPFFGGGAMFFYLKPTVASINDISKSLIDYYRLIKRQDKRFYKILMCYNESFQNLLSVCDKNYDIIYSVYNEIHNEIHLGNIDTIKDKVKVRKIVHNLLENFSSQIIEGFSEPLILDEEDFYRLITKMVADKMIRTVSNNDKKAFDDKDLKDNIITGFSSGYYMYFRKIYNDINLKRIKAPSSQYTAANFYFIREYCYGSMFRYNSRGEFNIPYGGISYNYKNFKAKIDNMFKQDIATIFKNTDIHCCDFAKFFEKANLTENDFMFLDPPYDTDFSEYDGKQFTKSDQERLAYELKNTLARFILVIKNTDFIYNLYNKDFNIISFDNKYTYNVRSRNEREVEHLIITNFAVEQSSNEQLAII